MLERPYSSSSSSSSPPHLFFLATLYRPLPPLHMLLAMSSGSLEVTLVSASISPYTSFGSDPCDTYATLKCTKEQHCTKNARDQGRLPVWNETFSFGIGEQDMSSDLVVQVFNVKSEGDELLGIARIAIYSMVGKEEATLCALVNPVQGEIGKLKAIWKWKPGSQTSTGPTNYERKASEVHEYSGRQSYNNEPYDTSHKAPSYMGDSNPVAYPHVLNQGNSSSERFGKLEAVSDAMAKLSMEKGSGRYSTSYPEEGGNFGKEDKAQGDYSYPPATPEAYAVAHPPMYETCARGGSDYGYPPPPPSDAYPLNKDAYTPHPSGTYPPPSDTYRPNKDAYTPHSSSAYPPPSNTYPPNNQEYSAYPSSTYPPPQSGAYLPQSGAYPPPSGAYRPNKEGYPPYSGSANPPYFDPYSTSGIPSEGLAYMEKGGGDKGKGGGGKEKEKGHGSHAPYGQPPPVGYPPSSYPPAPAGYSSYGHAPGGYPPAPHGYPPAPQGYPPAPHGYPSAPHGYPPAPHGYPPAGYPPQGYPPAHSAPGYPPQGYPASGHGSQGHKPDKHGHGSGGYVGHSSSSSKPSKKHKEPKNSSSHKHSKHKKQKSFKGMKKFKKFKF